jgi:hypothetical protein
VKRGRKEGKRKRMLGNKIFRIKRRKTNRVRNKYEDNMEISLDPHVASYLFNISPFHFPTSYIFPFHHLSILIPKFFFFLLYIVSFHFKFFFFTLLSSLHLKTPSLFLPFPSPFSLTFFSSPSSSPSFFFSFFY